MNIFLYIVMLSLVDELPELSEYTRANTRAARAKAIAHNKKVYHDLVGHGIWYENPNTDGEYCRYSGGQRTKKEQEGRWATERLSGHRRFQKWSRDYYDSKEVALDKYFQRIDKRWEERYGE